MRWLLIPCVLFIPSLISASEGEFPTVSVGGLLYAQYSYWLSGPDDINGLDITRAYINISAGLHENIRARITPDIARETTQTALQGSLLFRLKYAYLEVKDFLPPSSWVKFGLHETPWLVFEEGINRYRFQGTMFAERDGFIEREGFIPGSADFGLGYLQALPGGFGEVNASVVNGEGFKSPEVNKFKSFQVRATVRPVPRQGTLTGLRLSGFYENGYFGDDQPRRLAIGMVSFEHDYVVFTGQILKALNRKGLASVPVGSEGFSFFTEAKCPLGLAAMARMDYIDPNLSNAGDGHMRQIYGLAYWRDWGKSLVGILLNDEQVTYEKRARKPYEHRILLQTHAAF